MSAYLLLEDGTRFDGEAAGAPVSRTGEVVFNTSMSGYQESVTDPSYRDAVRADVAGDLRQALAVRAAYRWSLRDGPLRHD